MTWAAAGVRGAAPTDLLNSLVGILAEEQQLLERLRFALAQGGLLMGAGESRLLLAAAEEIDAAEYEVGMVEVGRALIVAELADHLGIEGCQPTLRSLIRAAPAPLRPRLANWREDLLRLSEQIATLAAAGREMAAAGANGTSAPIESLRRVSAAMCGGYSPGGSRDASGNGSTATGAGV